MIDQLRQAPVETESAGLAVIDDRHVVAAYARWAPFYDWSFGVFTATPRRAVMNEVNSLPPGRVLELGVGTGISLPDYDRRHRVVGVDLSPEMLDRARRRVKDDKLANVESLHEMDAGKLTFADASFDTAVAMFVITVVPDPDRVLAEMVRIVRPGGRIILANHFSVDTGPRASVERWLSQYSARLGWRPNFPIERVLGHPSMRLVERRPVKAFDLFTLLVFERV